MNGCWVGMSLPVSDQIQRSNSRLLSVPSHITANQRQERHERRRRGLGEVVACQTPAVIAQRQANDQRHAYNRDDEAYHCDQDAVLIVVACKTTSD